MYSPHLFNQVCTAKAEDHSPCSYLKNLNVIFNEQTISFLLLFFSPFLLNLQDFWGKKEKKRKKDPS